MRTIILLMGVLWRRGMTEEKLYHWPLVPREMLEDAKENGDMNAGCALGGVGAEPPAAGMPADEQPAEHTQARTHTASGTRENPRVVVCFFFFHSTCQLAALESTL